MIATERRTPSGLMVRMRPALVMAARNVSAMSAASHRDGHAAIDSEHLPVAEARRIGGEIDGGPAQLLGIAPAPQGRAFGDPVVECLVGAHAGIGLARVEARA